MLEKLKENKNVVIGVIIAIVIAMYLLK